MADEENQVEEAPKSNILLYAVVAAVVVLLGAGGYLFLLDDSAPADINVAKPISEYVVPAKMYQLKDGSYLKLGFSIVMDADQVEIARNIIEKDSPGRLPAGINLLLGNKGRDDLISGTHKREAFTRQLKKMLEERVFAEYNKKQTSAQDLVEIREVLVSDFVTQSG